jgi:hypothetical protein
MAGWHRTELGGFGELIWRIEAENPHGLLYQIADSGSGWLLASSPQFKFLRAIIVPPHVSMMHLFLG